MSWIGLAAPVRRTVAFVEKLLGTCPDCVYVLDLGTRTAVYRNRALHEMLGYQDHDVECPSAVIPRQLVHPEDRPDVEHLIEDLKRLSPNTMRIVSLRMRTAGGLWRHVSIRITPLEAGLDGLTRRVLGIATDVSEQKWAEERADTARAAAEHQSAAKSAFLAHVSHEIRTPLNAVAGAVSLLVGTELSGAQREYAGVIDRAAATLTDLVNDVLDLSKMEAGKLALRQEPYPLVELVEDVVRQSAPRALAKGLALWMDVHCEVPAVVHGDAARVRQMLVNLIGNAMKFTQEGEIVVAVEAPLRPDGGRTLTIRVRDTGVGIAASELPRLFEKYEQGANAYAMGVGGTGLGLAICRGFATAMGGELKAQSKLGAGSEFKIVLPLAPHEADGSAFPAHVLAAKVIHILGDAPARAESLAGFLSGLGAHVSVMATRDARLTDTLAFAVEPADAFILDQHEHDGPAARCLSALASAGNNSGTEPRRLAILAQLGPQLEQAYASAARINGAICLAQPASAKHLVDYLALGITGAAARPPAPQKDLGAFRVLAVDDNETNRQVLGRMLDTIGCQFALAPSGAAALALAADHDYDLVLMDCQMPGMNGFDATRALRLEARRMPIVALTANVTGPALASCLEAGMNAVLAKPLRLAELRAHLERWAQPGSHVEKESP